MRFAVSAAVLAFASSVLAQTPNFDPITKPTKDEDVKAGSTYTIEWQPSTAYTGTVTISLLGGKTPSTLEAKGTIKAGVDNSAGEYKWAVDSTLGADATYGIQITLDSDKTVFQYSFPFHIKGGKVSSSSHYPTSGTATVTISSKSYTMSYNSTRSYSTMYPTGNLSTTATVGPTKVTLTSTASRSTSATTSPSTVPTGAAASVAAGSFAMLGGLAMAVLAL